MRSSKEHLQKTSTEDLHQMRSRTSRLTELHDLIHLDPPLSEDAILRTMQARFFNQKYFVSTIQAVTYTYVPSTEDHFSFTKAHIKRCAS